MIKTEKTMSDWSLTLFLNNKLLDAKNNNVNKLSNAIDIVISTYNDRF